MKIYIFADMEGISGVSGSDFVKQDGRLYQEGRKYYTMDINACVNACFKAGAEEVVVRDGHSSGNHVIWSEFTPGAELVQGQSGIKRFPGIEDSSAIIFLGYHAMAGTPEALLEHTYSSASVQNMWVNGKLAGEFAIDSAIAAEYGVPTIMVSGDDKICAEAKEWIPELTTCEVKKGMTCQGAIMLSPEKAHKLIEEKTIEAIGKINEAKLHQVEKPVKLKKEFVERMPVKGGCGIEVIDGRTIEITSDSLEIALLN
jgi:D-amino peptidase